MHSLADIRWPLVLFGGGFLVSLLPALHARSRDRLWPVLIGWGIGLSGAAWFSWRAFQAGWIAFAIGITEAAGVIVLGFAAWLIAYWRIEDVHQTLLFRRHRNALESLAHEPEGAVTDPQLRADGILSFERQGDRVFFASWVQEDNGRTPDLLHGFVRAPERPPTIGDLIPRSTGRYNEGARPFRLVRSSRLGQGWWKYSAAEIWDDELEP